MAILRNLESLDQKVIDRLAFLTKGTKQELIRSAIVIVSLGLFGFLFSTFFSRYGIFFDLAETRCMPAWVYVGYPKTPTLQRGDIVSFNVKDATTPIKIFNGQRLAKIIAGMPGDLVESNEEGVKINGKPIALRNPISLSKMAEKKMVPINVNRVLQPGELFVMGTLPRSFDSRYWGILQATEVERMVKAVF